MFNVYNRYTDTAGNLHFTDCYEKHGREHTIRADGGAGMSELKPCPFCGNDSPTLIQRHGKDGWRDWFYVLCDYVDCGCGATGQWNHEESDAIEAWNRRAET